MDTIKEIYEENKNKNKEPLYVEVRRRSHKMNITLKQAYSSVVGEVTEVYKDYLPYKNFASFYAEMYRKHY